MDIYLVVLYLPLPVCVCVCVCVGVCVCVLKPADWPVMFRSEQHVLTLAAYSLSFHYTTAHPGLSDCMCVCV